MSSDVSFSVNPDDLDALRGRLSAIESGMASIGTVSGSCDPLDLDPDMAIWNALQSFHQDWSDGLSMISHNIEALSVAAASAAQDYRGTDEQIAAQSTPRAGTA